jgi:hypothetical protein
MFVKKIKRKNTIEQILYKHTLTLSTHDDDFIHS